MIMVDCKRLEQQQLDERKKHKKSRHVHKLVFFFPYDLLCFFQPLREGFDVFLFFLDRKSKVVGVTLVLI